ncbi:MAG TPA: dynamin family protein, partial [Planctomycetota bacterium]|nr:dynamin family protein [Planctomycetota bacterium]
MTTSTYSRSTFEPGSGAYMRPGADRSLGPKELDRLEEELRALEAELRALHEQMEKDARGRQVARGMTQYRSADPISYLDRARELLTRRDYDVAFVGNFSCGKSTLINAVLAEPRFLPTDQTECTLAIARVGPPHPERGEGIEVEFFTEQEALQNVLANNRYRDDFGEPARKLARAFDADRAQKLLHDFANDEKNDPPKREEIRAFLDELDLRRRDGSLQGNRKIWAPLSERSRFLSKQGGGIGPILLVKEVRLFRENPLFVERGVRVVDLPGTNAVSAAVEEKIDEFLRRADVVIGVTGPEGFTRDERTMLERFQKFNIGAANRVMFVMNRMDLLDPKNLISAEAFRSYFRKNFVEVVEGARLRADRIFFGSALWVELEITRDRTVDEESRHHQIEVALGEGRRFLEQMKGLDPELKRMLQTLYEEGGIPTFRAELLRFLERDVRRERLREVALQLRAVRERMSQLLEPERPSLGEVTI